MNDSKPNSLRMPSCDDKPLWDVMQSGYHFRSMCAADRLGVFSFLAKAYVAELPVVCELTKAYVAEYGLSDRIDTLSFDMFNDDWPSGYDALPPGRFYLPARDATE